MRPITRTTLCALAATAMAAPAYAPADYYLHLGDVKDESAARDGGGHKDWIEIQSWSWGATNSGKYGAVGGMHRDESVAVDGADAASMPTEKRQHGWMPSNRPLDRGSLRVKVKFPWDRCAVGTAFPDAVLQNDAGRYELKDVQVTGCAADSVSLDYAKVIVRGWDPKTKQQ